MRRNTRDITDVLVNNIEENIDINIEKNENLEQRICPSSQLRKLKCIEKVFGKYQILPIIVKTSIVAENSRKGSMYLIRTNCLRDK